MRIISGTARGRKLFRPRYANSIRPTTDRAREALFSIIGPEIKKKTFLDLFAGTGAVGCEALSRNGRSSCFIDSSTHAIDLIKKNVTLIPNGTEKATIIRHDLRKGIPEGRLVEQADVPFDIIFADPPYEKGLSAAILTSLNRCSLLAKQLLVIIEEKKDVILPEVLPRLQQVDTRTYGDSVFHFYRSRPGSS